MRLCALTVGFLLLPLLIHADTYSVTRMTADGHSSEARFYSHSDILRFEQTRGNVPAVTLVNRASHSSIIVDPVRREYMPLDSTPGWMASLAMWLQRPLTPEGPRMTVHDRFELIDTGEQRLAFGHLAKHLRLVEETVAPPGACLSSSRTERDGWYFADRPSKASQRGYIGIAPRFRLICTDEVVQDGPPPPVLGYAVYEKVIAFGRVQVTREMLEFSETALDAKLFQVPAGYRKVDKMPQFPSQKWTDRMTVEWSMLTAAVESWFD